jgi:arsenical-resistance protein
MAELARNPKIGFFEKYLTLWVTLCIVAGITLGHLLPGVFHAVGAAEVAKVNIPVAVLIWLMVIPMLLKIDFAALSEVGRHWRGIGVTLFVNWAVKPFSMALLGWLFVGWLFRPYLPAEQIDSYIAGLIILAAAPCTAMVFVWSNLTKGEPHFTLSQVALNDAIMVVAFAPIVALLLGLSAITVPWDTLVLSVVLYIVIPVIVARLLRRNLLTRGGDAALVGLLLTLQPLSLVSLLATLVLLFGFQGEQIIAQPLGHRPSGRPDPDSGLLQLGPRLRAQPHVRRTALRGRAFRTDRRVELLRTRRRGGHQPVRFQFRSGPRDRGGRPCRGSRHAVGRLDREPLQGLVRTRGGSP